jgi:hypothetical protein
MNTLSIRLALLIALVTSLPSFVRAATAEKQTFVLVHGATAGGWEWKRTGRFLTDDGHTWMNARHYLAETLQLYFQQ